MKKTLLLCVLVSLAGGPAESALGPAQGADPAFNAAVARPAYEKRHPKVLFDEAHNNADTAAGLYKPFADLIRSDGYELVPLKTDLSKKDPGDFEIFVVVNATGPGSERETSPFTKEECYQIRDWVKAGGSLLLISDHLPFSAALSELAKQFDVELTKGFTIDTVNYNKQSEDQTELVFTRDNGLIAEHPITRGRDRGEELNKVNTFSGTSIKGPAGSVPFLKLSASAMDVLPPPPDNKPRSPEEALPEHKQVSAAGRAQGVAFEFGKGRVVVLAEAAMLTAQVAPRGLRFGMNVPGIDNRQLALNIMHWLSRLL